MFRPMEEPARMVFCTCPDSATAERLAGMLVEERLAACVNLLHGARSIYRWQEKVESATETLMVIKTTAAVYSALASRLAEEHPYEIPEIIALQVADGLPGYLEWVNSCVAVS
jgi:periplasmic divalent cation tolerance protein